MTAAEIIAKLTENEISVMKALYTNKYGDRGDGVYSWAVAPRAAVNAKSVPGIIGSLVKKGICKSEEYERGEDVIYLTNPIGFDVMGELARQQGWE